MFVSVLGVEVESNVFAFLIERRLRCAAQALGKSRLAIELMRQLARGEHGFGVGTSGLA
jgi:alkylation response protein AidB-like acyl-CoA dehydrogenase